MFREDTGSPGHQLLLPISQASSPVVDILLGFSSSQLDCRGIQNEERSLYFHNRALQELAKLIDGFKEAAKEEVLSTILLLLYYEVVSCH